MCVCACMYVCMYVLADILIFSYINIQISFSFLYHYLLYPFIHMFNQSCWVIISTPVVYAGEGNKSSTTGDIRQRSVPFYESIQHGNSNDFSAPMIVQHYKIPLAIEIRYHVRTQSTLGTQTKVLYTIAILIEPISNSI